MYKISEKFQNCLENDFSFVTKSKIVVEEKEYLSNIIKTTPKIVHKNEKMIGGFPTKTCSFEMYNFDGLNFIGKEVAVYRGLLVDGEIEYIPQGIFIPREEDVTNNISQRTISFNNIQDKTQFFDAQYQSSLDWSTKHTGLEIVQEICNNLNIELESTDFNWATYEFQQPNFVETTTYREVVSRLAEIGGNIAFINRLGQLSIKGQMDTEHVVKRKRYVDLKKENLFGPINTVVLGKEGINDNIVFPESIEETRKEWKIYDNPFVDLYRQDMIEEVSKYIIGKSIIPFTLNDFVDGFYLDLNDTISIIDKNGETFVGTILNYENNSRIKSNIGTDVQTDSKTNYNLAGSNKKSLQQIRLDVDHTNQRLEAVAEDVSENSSKITQLELDSQSITARVEHTETEIQNTNDNLEQNYYERSQVEQMVLDFANGVTNTFSEAGGNNLLRNTDFSAKEVLEEGQEYEYWFGNADRLINNNSANGYSVLVKKENFYQEQNVANGNYTLSFYYKIVNELATVKVIVNGKEYSLDKTSFTLFQTGIQNEDGTYKTDPITISDNHLKVEFITDIDDAVEIYDIMCNAGTVKLAYSQNANETRTDTVNIGKGIKITSTTSDTEFVATPEVMGFKSVNGNDMVTEFTNKGMSTKEAIIEDKAEIVGILRQKVGNQIWDSAIGV